MIEAQSFNDGRIIYHIKMLLNDTFDQVALNKIISFVEKAFKPIFYQ